MRAVPFQLLLIVLLLSSCVEQTATSLLKSSTENVIPFTLISTTPADGQGNVGSDQSIDIQFSQTVLPSSIQLNSGSVACSGTIQLSTDSFSSCEPIYLVGIDGANVQIKPVKGFSTVAGKIYKLKISAAISSNDGKSLSTPLLYLSGFTIWGDLSNPTIVSISPANGQTEVDKDSAIAVQFSEPMDAATFTASNNTDCTGNIQLSKDHKFSTCLALQTPVTLIHSGVGFSLNPSESLTAGETYYLKVLNTIQDTVGKTILTTSITSFQVAKTRKVQVSWSDSKASRVMHSDGGGGYRIYYSQTSGFALDHYATLSMTVPYVSGSSEPHNSATLDFPHKGKWYFKVTAYSIDNPIGSAPSDEVALEVQ